MEPVELVTMNVKPRSIRCRHLDSQNPIVLQTPVRHIVPGMVITVKPQKIWAVQKRQYMLGEIFESKIDIPALGIKQLRLKELGLWDPETHYWGEEDKPREEWELKIIRKGKRPEYEMEQVLPGMKEDDYDSDPIREALELKDSGHFRKALNKLSDILEEDIRCIDAHSHLGLFKFDSCHEWAGLYYEVGVRIGEYSLGDGFNGLLSWGAIENRPFLRCLHGYGLCLWRAKRFKEAADVFNKMLWLNPNDNQGVRFLVPDVEAGRSWEECCDY